MKLPELKKILKNNKIKGYSACTKPVVTEALRAHGLMPEIEPPNYEILKTIRNEPKRVEMTDMETKEVKVYPSIYRAGKTLSINPGLIKYHNGRTYKNYKIKILY